MNTDDIEEIARTCHEVHRAYCIGLGDFSQRPWNRAPQRQTMGAVAGVKAVLEGFITSPEEHHRAWIIRMEALGWVRGDLKDDDAKTHPCMVPYDDLPQIQRTKCSLFIAVVNGLRHPGPWPTPKPTENVGRTIELTDPGRWAIPLKLKGRHVVTEDRGKTVEFKVDGMTYLVCTRFDGTPDGWRFCEETAT